MVDDQAVTELEDGSIVVDPSKGTIAEAAAPHVVTERSALAKVTTLIRTSRRDPEPPR